MKKSEVIPIPKLKPRYTTDPHKRDTVIPSKKVYDRKKPVRGPDDSDARGAATKHFCIRPNTRTKLSPS